MHVYVGGCGVVCEVSLLLSKVDVCLPERTLNFSFFEFYQRKVNNVIDK